MGLFACFADIYRNEGLKGLWRGVGPTAQRAAVVVGKHFTKKNKVVRVAEIGERRERRSSDL